MLRILKTNYLKILILLIISFPFFIIGSLICSYDYKCYITDAETNAQYVALNINIANNMGKDVKIFIDQNHRFPNIYEVECIVYKCSKEFPYVPSAVIHPVGTDQFKLEFIGNMGAICNGEFFIWSSKDGTTNQDNLVTKWGWEKLFIPKSMWDLLITFFPLICLLLYCLIKKIIRILRKKS